MYRQNPRRMDFFDRRNQTMLDDADINDTSDDNNTPFDTYNNIVPKPKQPDFYYGPVETSTMQPDFTAGVNNGTPQNISDDEPPDTGLNHEPHISKMTIHTTWIQTIAPMEMTIL